MNKTILFLIIICSQFTINSYAQTPVWIWGKDATDAQNGGGIAIAVAKDVAGNIYHTGIIDDSITFGSTVLVNTDTGFSSTYLVKYDQSGNLIWAKCSSGPGGTICSAITIDGACNIYVTGYYFGGSVSFGAYTLDTTDYDGIFMVKYDSSGNVLWAVDCDPASIGYPYGIATDLANNVYLTGTIYSPTINFGPFSLPDDGLVNIFLVKYDSSANVIWAKKAGRTGIDKPYGIATDTLGNEYITGYFNSPYIIFGNDTLNNLGNHNVYIAKYDSSGNALWARGGGGIYGDLGLAIASDKNANEYVTGEFTSPSITFGAFTLTSTGGENMFLARYDAAGNVKWITSTVQNFNCNCFPFDVAVDNNSNPVVIGVLGYPAVGPVTFDTITLTAPPDTHLPMYIVKYDSSGHSMWGIMKVIGGGDDNSNGSIVINSNAIYITAEFEADPSIYGHDTLHNLGIHTPFLAKLGYQSFEGFIDPKFERGISIYPNPNNGNFIIVYHLTTPDALIQLTDIAGRVVYTHYIYGNEGIETVTTSELSNGIYFWKVISDNHLVDTGKIAVIK